MEAVSQAKQPDSSVIASELAALKEQATRMNAALQKAEQLLERHLLAGEKTIPARALHAILRDGYGPQQNQEIRQAPQPIIQKLEQFPNRFEAERIRAETRLSVHDAQVRSMSPVSRWWHRRELKVERRELVNEVTHTREMAALARDVSEQLRPLAKEPQPMRQLNEFSNHFETERIRAKEKLNLHDRRAHQMSPIGRWWHGRELTIERQHLLDNLVRARHSAELSRQVTTELKPVISPKPSQEKKVVNQQQAVKQQQEIKPRQGHGMRM
jgi:hypothetical protein